MAMECSGEVYVMTNTRLDQDIGVPLDGIWWEVEFPTLIDESRAADKKVTKVSTCGLSVPVLLSLTFAFLTDQLSPSAVSEQGPDRGLTCRREEQTP